jgi:chemotaxis signal transduction protein
MENSELQILLFKLKTNNFAVSLDHVRHVVQIPPDFISRGEQAQSHLVFDDSPITYISLWDRLQLGSGYAEYEDLQAMLPLRQKEHLGWMDGLESSIRSGTPFTKARDPHECAFGKWFYAYQTQDKRLSILLKQFEQPHAKIHALADKLLSLVDAGQRDEAMQAFEHAKQTTLAELLQLFAETQRLLITLQRRIAVIVGDGDVACALGADGVHNILSMPVDRIKHSPKAESNAVSALIILDDDSLVPLLNWRTFCEVPSSSEVQVNDSF